MRLPNFYFVDAEINALVDPETGDITDLDKLDELMLEREKKIDFLIKMCCEQKALEEACDAEIKRMKEHLEAVKADKAKCEAKLGEVLQYQKYDSGIASISFKPSEAVIIENEASLPLMYKKEPETIPPEKWKANKILIKKMLKDGMAIDGCHLEQRQNIQIK